VYLAINLENFITVSLMLVVFILIVHGVASLGVGLPGWLSGVGA
jgi:hypothetical protein